ncbi:hypothetical protein H2248_008981 [Termitomyces sp. 'cryptogamus']|nr:hypothetical protein H2248_008981 [Termitomyces sp. 'cryptogamus']
MRVWMGWCSCCSLPNVSDIEPIQLSGRIVTVFTPIPAIHIQRPLRCCKQLFLDCHHCPYAQKGTSKAIKKPDYSFPSIFRLHLKALKPKVCPPDYSLPSISSKPRSAKTRFTCCSEMSETFTKFRSVHFADQVDWAVYSPEAPISVASSYAVPSNPGHHLSQGSFGQAIHKKSENRYRDGIHTELREPSVIFRLDGHVEPVVLFDRSILHAPATEPYVPSFIISSRSFPWTITVLPQDGRILTVQDVLYGIINHLQRPAANELDNLWRVDRAHYHEVESRRKRRIKEEKLNDTSARWIDWLPSEEHVFLGLSSEQGSVMDSTERILKVKWSP